MLGDFQDSVTGKPSTPTTTGNVLDVDFPATSALLLALTPGTNVHSTALEKSHVISAGACTLRSIVATNTGAADAWLHLFDLTALPANGTVPDRAPIPVPAGSPQGWSSVQGSSFAVGCVAALSSTLGTLTLIAASEALFDAEKAAP